uniref:Putative secreted protein n=1 Tax=Ixodes ricinus TaxID=34613 RepID=A0A090X9A7_IXORI
MGLCVLYCLQCLWPSPEALQPTIAETELDPHRKNDREGCDFLQTGNEGTPSIRPIFLHRRCRMLLQKMAIKGLCQKRRNANLTTDTRVPSNHDGDTPVTTKKAEAKRRKKPKESLRKSKGQSQTKD